MAIEEAAPATVATASLYPIIEQECFASYLPAPDALAAIKQYSDDYSKLYGNAFTVEFTLLGLQQVEDIERELLEDLQCSVIEDAVAEQARILAAEGPWWERKT